MNVRCVAMEELTGVERDAWVTLCSSEARYRSPFFHPGYAEAVARHQAGVEVAVVDEIGFFPFVRTGSGRGRVLGGKLTDYHGPVLASGVAWDALELAKACDLASWSFTHLPAGMPGFQPYEWAQSESPYLDLKDGFAAYCDGRKAAGSGLIPQVRRKARKLERECGAVRFVWDDESPDSLQQLLSWKAAQRRETRTYNILEQDWARAVVEELHCAKDSGVKGVLSSLYVGDTLAAAHFGLCTATTLHWWFPAYGRELSRYSPGLILLLELAKAGADRGITMLDLGKGKETYKEGFRSAAVSLSEGSVHTRALHAGWSRTAIALRERIRNSPLHDPVKRAKGFYRAFRYR